MWGKGWGENESETERDIQTRKIWKERGNWIFSFPFYDIVGGGGGGGGGRIVGDSYN